MKGGTAGGVRSTRRGWWDVAGRELEFYRQTLRSLRVGRPVAERVAVVRRRRRRRWAAIAGRRRAVAGRARLQARVKVALHQCRVGTTALHGRRIVAIISRTCIYLSLSGNSSLNVFFTQDLFFYLTPFKRGGGPSRMRLNRFIYQLNDKTK